jgi:hypothetical protein
LSIDKVANYQIGKLELLGEFFLTFRYQTIISQKLYHTFNALADMSLIDVGKNPKIGQSSSQVDWLRLNIA